MRPSRQGRVRAGPRLVKGRLARRRPAVRVTVQKSLLQLRRVRRQIHLPTLPIISDAIGRSRLQSVEGLTPEAALHASRNFRFGVLNGVMFTLVDALIAPSLVLALFINRLGAPNVLVGLLPAIITGGWFLPQILVAGRVQGQRRVMHWYRSTGIIRLICMVILSLSTFLLAGYPSALLVVFFIFYSIYAFGAGVSGIPWLEMVGKVVSIRRRGSFFSLRSFWGGLIALLSSGFIVAILSEKLTGLTFPYNFAVLFSITTVVVGVGLWAWSTIHEPEGTVTVAPVTVLETLRRGRAAFGVDRDYRSFMIARVLLSLATISDPFYVVFARTQLQAPASTVGLYVGATSAASLLSNFIWGPLSDRAGNRILMRMTALSVATVPLAALLIPLLGGALPADVVYTLFAVVFVLVGLAGGSGRIVNNNMLLTIAPPAQRATYIGFLNTLLGLVTFIPVAGGIVADELGFTVLFVITLALTGLALLATAKMSVRRVAE